MQVLVPAGATVRLVDEDGRPVATATLPSEGRYNLDAATGALTFTPRLGFAVAGGANTS
ncbi:hypothetical protein GCM10011331_23460 [Flavimobilis marinus]|uniref:hypothetical protein n=1 Tax=Flavimobilis marinus TaxID=285351 RepID=UPI0015A53220|nr:hypothetical protein [Flavimobilis marinus]GHG56205.1 hypothetical protein GCM10011331_23460 [Flavimobilis marinus]